MEERQKYWRDCQKREIKESTVWQHLAELIEYSQLSLWKVLPPNKARLILSNTLSENDPLKAIKARIKDASVSFDEINCALSYIKNKNRPKNIMYHFNQYKKFHCLIKCCSNKNQRKERASKFNKFISKNPHLKMNKQEFLDLFNNHLTICVLPEKSRKVYP